MRDYFPFKAGSQYIYEYSSSEFEGLARVVVTLVSVSGAKKEICANFRMRVELKGHSTSTDYFVRKSEKEIVSEDGIVVGGRIEFPLPVAAGRKWEASPDSSEIVSSDESLEVPAGKYKNCLKIVTLLSGGDSGSAVRYYAPDIGYAYEKYTGDDLQAEVSLVSVGSAPVEDMKPPKNTSRPTPGPEYCDEPADFATEEKPYRGSTKKNRKGGK
jgi:hypothetical protein